MEDSFSINGMGGGEVVSELFELVTFIVHFISELIPPWI